MSALVLVTGANGFVGRHLIEALLKSGYRVRALDREFTHIREDGAERITADILDHVMVRAAMEDVEIVFHLAAIAALWLPDESAYQTVNVEGTSRVLDAAIDAGVRRFVYCSSFVTTISGPREKRMITEGDIAEPKALFGAYAKSKRRADRLVMEAKDRIEPVILMPSAPLGAVDYNLTAPTAFIRDLVNGKIPAIIDQVTNFIDVTLLANAMARAADRAAPATRYLLTGENRKIEDFLAIVGDLSGSAMPKSKVPYAIAAGFGFFDENVLTKLLKRPPAGPYAGIRMAGRPFKFDNDLACKTFEIDLNPIEEAVGESLAWLDQQGALTKPLPTK